MAAMIQFQQCTQPLLELTSLQPFLAATFDITSFFTQAFLVKAAPFLLLSCFA